MEQYQELARELITDHISDVKGWDSKKTTLEILEDLLDDTENVFGNLDGSRTCNTWEAEQFINKSNAIFDSEIVDLFESIDENYLSDTLKRGPETFDVVTLELVAPQVIQEMIEEL